MVIVKRKIFEKKLDVEVKVCDVLLEPVHGPGPAELKMVRAVVAGAVADDAEELREDSRGHAGGEEGAIHGEWDGPVPFREETNAELGTGELGKGVVRGHLFKFNFNVSRRDIDATDVAKDFAPGVGRLDSFRHRRGDVI